MRQRQITGLIFSALLAPAGWALGELVDGIDWLPSAMLLLSAGGMAISGSWWLASWVAERSRKAIPGFGVHMAIQLKRGQGGRRRYIFDLGRHNGIGASLFISASDKLTFIVRDSNGEPYPIEVELGRDVPVEQPIYLAAEVGVSRKSTITRIILDGNIVAERTIPFSIDFIISELKELTFGASVNKTEHGAFILNNVALVKSTLSDRDARKMAAYQADRTGAAS